MKMILVIVVFLSVSVCVAAQSGRRARQIVKPAPPPVAEVAAPKPQAQPEEQSPVTAERNQDYRCTDDGSLARVLDTAEDNPLGLTAKQVDSRVVISSKPSPTYTKEARRIGIQGFVVLKTLMSAGGNIARVRVVKQLPGGLTENAIRAACKIKFKPAIKDGQAVAQWVTVEYVFRLADSSVFTP
jgi:TonB family protein